MNINWLEISENYPKAYNKLIGENGETQRLIPSSTTKAPILYILNDKYFHQRDLYDFFDEQKVFIKIVPSLDGFTYSVYEDHEDASIDKSVSIETRETPLDGVETGEDVIVPKKKGGRFKKAVDVAPEPVTGNFPTRDKAEESAFNEAFVVLEEKLN